MGEGARRAAIAAGDGGTVLGRLILDTSILVAAERGRTGLGAHVSDRDDAAVAAITIAELLTGVELSTGRHRSRRLAYVSTLLGSVPVEDYDLDVARAHAFLLAHVKRTGRPRGAHDLIIAATAIARDREVITNDERGFSDLPGVTVR